MSDYTNLGVQKQDTLIRATNGVAVSRELYTQPASLCLATYAPDLESGTILGEFCYKIEYEFSGMKAPGLTSVIQTAQRDAAEDRPQP